MRTASDGARHHLHWVQGLLPVPQQHGRFPDCDADVHPGRQTHITGQPCRQVCDHTSTRWYDLQEEFSRAVHICTGKHLSRHMVHTGTRIKHRTETNFSCSFSFSDFRRWRRRSTELPGVCCHDEGQDPPRPENPQQTRRVARLQTMCQAGNAGVQLEQIPSLIEYVIDPLCPWGCCHCHFVGNFFLLSCYIESQF